MSTERTALRKITFPFTPDTFQEIIHPLNYLVYRLPYSTSILLYNDILNPLVTRTFKPNERFVETEVLNDDPNSVNYNKHVIEDYIKQGIFSRLPLTYTTTEGTPGVPADPTVFNIETVTTLVSENLGTQYTLGQSNYFKRGNLISWIARYSSDGVTEVPRVYTYNLNTDTLSFYPVEIDVEMTYYLDATSIVIDSTGKPWTVFYTPNVGTPANSDLHLTTYNAGAGTVNMKQSVGGSNTIIRANSATVLRIYNLLIDSSDNIYISADAGIFKVVGGLLELLIDSAPFLTDFRYSEYNIATDTFLVTTDDGRLLELDVDGNILRDSGSMNNFGTNGFATGGSIGQLFGFASDGPPNIAVMPYFGSDLFGGIYIGYNNNNTIQGFTDGDQNTGERTNYDSPVLKYDLSDSDIYFIDTLNNIGI